MEMTPSFFRQAASAAETVPSKSNSGCSRSALEHAWSALMKLTPTRARMVSSLGLRNLANVPADTVEDELAPSDKLGLLKLTPLLDQDPVSRSSAPLKSTQK